MLLKPKIGFLFDVDGTLTTFKRNDSVVDLLIINDLELIRKKKHPIGLVTGRGVDWVRNFFFNHINETLREYILIFGEYGLVNWYKGKKIRKQIKKEIKENLFLAKDEFTKEICEYLELESYVSYEAPDKRSLWIEPKELMITYRSLPFFGLIPERFLKIINPILEKYSDTLKAYVSEQALDILPVKESKKTAAEKAIRILDPNKEIELWYAFGDSESDEDMALARNGNVKFFKIETSMTSDLHRIIQKILAGGTF